MVLVYISPLCPKTPALLQQLDTAIGRVATLQKEQG